MLIYMLILAIVIFRGLPSEGYLPIAIYFEALYEVRKYEIQ